MIEAEIIRIDERKNSRNPEQTFIRVHFKTEGGTYYKTDLVPGFRNWRRWKSLLRVGNILCNLDLKNAETLDADSWPIFLKGRRTFKDNRTEDEKLAEFSAQCLS